MGPILAILLQAAWPAPGPSASFMTPTGAVRVRLEVARDGAARTQGLMRRRRLDADAGMVFIFANAQQRAFWMKDTYLSLDIIFIDAQHRVVGVVSRAEPMTTRPQGVPTPAQFVVEVQAGFAQAHQIGAGTQVRWERLSLEAHD